MNVDRVLIVVVIVAGISAVAKIFLDRHSRVSVAPVVSQGLPPAAAPALPTEQRKPVENFRPLPTSAPDASPLPQGNPIRPNTGPDETRLAQASQFMKGSLDEMARRSRIYQAAFTSEANARTALAEIEKCMHTQVSQEGFPEAMKAQVEIAQKNAKSGCEAMAHKLGEKFPALSAEVNRVLKP